MNRNFLKEAIADAKTVKESAIANAKIALEEAFAPRIQSMLSAKLEEMDSAELEEEMDAKKKEADKKDSDKMEEGMPKEAPRAKNKETRKTEDEKYENDLAEGDDDKELEEILAELDKELSEEKFVIFSNPFNCSTVPESLPSDLVTEILPASLYSPLCIILSSRSRFILPFRKLLFHFGINA